MLDLWALALILSSELSSPSFFWFLPNRHFFQETFLIQILVKCVSFVFSWYFLPCSTHHFHVVLLQSMTTSGSYLWLAIGSVKKGNYSPLYPSVIQCLAYASLSKNVCWMTERMSEWMNSLRLDLQWLELRDTWKRNLYVYLRMIICILDENFSLYWIYSYVGVNSDRNSH